MTRKALLEAVASRAVLATVLALPMMGVSINSAMAQATTGTSAPIAQHPTAEPAPEKDSSLRVEEVIVTARKREESVQKIPISITPITTQLKTADVRNLSDIVAFTPNVRIDQYSQRASAATITIRGISPSRLDDNSIDSPIGVIIDGIYLGTLTGQLVDNFDLQRIEVLRGPQGTLFGRNTIGGALNVIRTEPTGEWGLRAQYTTGSFDDQEFRIVANAPIVKDVLAAKLYFISINRDGYLHNTFLNTNQPQRDYKNFGIALKFTPNERFKAILTADDYIDKSQGGAFLTNYNTGPGVLAPPSTASDINAPGSALAGTGGAELATFLPAAFGLTNTPARTNLALPNSISTSNTAPGDVKTWALTLNASYKLTDNLKLISVTGYRDQHEKASEDFDGSSADFINIATDAHYHQFSQELRVEGNWDTRFGKINAVLGGYYFTNYFDRGWVTSGDFWDFVSDLSGYNLANNTWLGSNPMASAAATGFADPISACLAPRTTAALQAVFGRVQCDATVPGGGAGYGAKFLNKLYESQGTDSYAGFAHVDWEFLPRLTFSAGLRYTFEKKHFIGYQSYLTPLSLIDSFNFPSEANLTRDWSQLTPAFSLAWQTTPDVLFYASYSQGWHSGGFFGVNQNTADFLSNQYDPETSDSYEIGMKGQFFNHRVQLNLAGFLTDFANKQESAIAFDKTTNTVVTLFTNVGGLRYEGVEGELQWVVTRQLSFAGSFGYLHAEYTDLKIGYPGNQTAAVPIVNATFLTPRNAPDLTLGGSATYIVPGIGPGNLALNARIDWVSKEQGDLYNASQFVIPAHEDVALSASYAYKNYKFTAFGRNVTDWRHEIPTFVAPLFASGTINIGATWGIELEAKF